MKGLIAITVRLVRAVRRAYAQKWSFLWLFAIAFLGSISILAEFDLLPETSPALATLNTIVADQSVVADTRVSAEIPELPAKIAIPTIGLLTAVANPTATDVATLDAELLKGAVRYPTSAKLGEMGNVVLFGHSSYLPVVNNQAFKTFNGIQKLSVGDLVTVSSSQTAYTYRVRSVAKESAKNAAIPLSVEGRVLTLSTCNSFGEKSDRFVVVADFVESHSLGA